MSIVKKQHWAPIITTLLALGIGSDNFGASWPSNARNDPFPPHSSWDPQYFLYEREKQLMFGMPDEKGTPERVMISLSPFGQNATKAKTLAATYCKNTLTNACDVCTNPVILANPSFDQTTAFCMNDVELGDIDGRWNLLGLLAGEIPQGASYPALLMNAFTTIFPNTEPGTVTAAQIEATDPCNPLFGYVSVPLKYRKRGIRWDVEAQICGDFGVQFLGGVAEISQVLNPCFINLTPSQTGGATCSTAINAQDVTCLLYDQLVPLMRQLGLNICNFTKWGIEDLYFALYWRHAHTINFDKDLSWPRLLLIPFIRAGGSVATGHIKDPSLQFSLPFGNNGSNSVDLNAGMNMDFAETVEIGAEVGYSHFFKKDFDNYRAPTNVLQSGIYPFATPASVQPGGSVYFAAKLAAYHFLDRLSFLGQWVFVHHRKDTIHLLSNDPAFIAIDENNPQAKCPNTAWRVQLGNFALNYDISPNLGIGMLWQQMFHVRNAYNSTTVLFTLNLIF